MIDDKDLEIWLKSLDNAQIMLIRMLEIYNTLSPESKKKAYEEASKLENKCARDIILKLFDDVLLS